MELNEICLPSPSSVDNMKQELDMRNLQIIEEGPRISQETDMKNLQIIEEGPRICPLCSQEIKLYFINYNEKIQMCENIECDYPFGHIPLKVFREENGVQLVEVKSLDSKKTSNSRLSGLSQRSVSGWSDVDKVCNVFDVDYVPSDGLDKLLHGPKQQKSEAELRREELKQNVEKIKEMTKSMSEVKKSSGIIKNENWIKNLSYLSGLSGINLLKPEEMKKMKKKVLNPGAGELKIDIDKNNLSSIKIEFGPNSKKP